ncbi:MAG: hypothetical protein O2909_12770 [Chloroflexi bacterium]|nr:hypothetical protein [Chloroflexota bacterium]MDA1220283.1 hypothetical protein [Chloroflexota bacterium]
MEQSTIMDSAQEQQYLQLALNRSDILCSEAPTEILQACSDDVEPTPFLEEFFGTGYSNWVYQKYGRRLPQERINNAIIVLWNRACRLHTNILTGVESPDQDKPFFSDEGLYEA